MQYEPTLEEWNWHVLMLGQAMIGAVSDNFRLVALRFCDDFWEVVVVLKHHDFRDEEEIGEIADETSIHLMNAQDKLSSFADKRIRTQTIISDTTLDIQDSDRLRVVFQKREY